jgi:hypothetical protein
MSGQIVVTEQLSNPVDRLGFDFGPRPPGRPLSGQRALFGHEGQARQGPVNLGYPVKWQDRASSLAQDIAVHKVDYGLVVPC